MNTLTKILIDYPAIFLAYLHELCHFIPGRLFGFDAKIVINPPRNVATYFDYLPNDWRNLVVTLGPIFAGYIGLLIWIITASQLGITPGIFDTLLFATLWQLACFDDYRQVVLFFV